MSTGEDAGGLRGFGGWEPRSLSLADQLTGTLSAVLDEQLQQWHMSYTEIDNTLQQQEALVATLVDDVENALGEERQKRQSIAQTLESAKKYIEARRVGPVELDEYYERLEGVAASLDDDFGETNADDPTEALYQLVDSAGEGCGRVQDELISKCRRRFLRMNLSPEELFRMLDKDGSGFVDEEEFISVVREMDTTHIEALFNAQDEDDSGHLNEMEVRNLALNLGRSLTTQEVVEAVKQMDPSGDGKVDFDEFTQWWRKQAQSSGGLLSAEVAKRASAMDQDYRWFFSMIEADHTADGQISLRELSTFVWAWEPETEYRNGDCVIAWERDATDPAVYVAQGKGKSGTETPTWQPGAGGAKEVARSVQDGDLTWMENPEQAMRLSELCREPT